MSKLLAHIKAMQAQAAAYIEPTPTYTSIDGRVSPAGSLEKQGRDRLFIEDMIHMLDGPEQREAQAEADLSAEAFAAMREFCARVDRGEVRSKRTYEQFAAILERVAKCEPAEDPMKALLRKMFEGWILHEQSQEKRTEEERRSVEPEDAMIQACGGDKFAGELLSLFGHWSNDIVSIAAHYGIGMARKQPDGTLVYEDGTVDTLLLGGELVVTEVPPAPSPEHWWHKGRWNAPEQEFDQAREA